MAKKTLNQAVRKKAKSDRIYVKSRSSLNKSWASLVNRWQEVHEGLTAAMDTMSWDTPIQQIDFKSFHRRTEALKELSEQLEELRANMKALEDSVDVVTRFISDAELFVWNDISAVKSRQ